MKKLLLLFMPLIMFSQESTITGDVDCNGEINSEDASLILQFVTNVIDELPCQNNMTGLTPEQLQEIISMVDEQLSINYSGVGAHNYPIMISTISSVEMNCGDALIYCSELIEGGYDDWFLPNLNQLTYSLSGGCELPDERTTESLWTTSTHNNGWGSTVIVHEGGASGISSNNGSYEENCRCVRFGAGEASEDLGGASNLTSSGSSMFGNSEQPITMIGPMYKQLEFIDFNHYYKYNYPDNTSNYIYYSDAIRFCSQLSYNGYNDWFLPSFRQIQNYLQDNPNDFIIPNFNENSSYYFWLFLNEIQTSGNGGYLYSPTIEVTGALHAYPNMVTVFIPYSLSDYMPHCFCVR